MKDVICLNVWHESGRQNRMQDRVYSIEGQSVSLTSFCDRLNVLIDEEQSKGSDNLTKPLEKYNAEFAIRKEDGCPSYKSNESIIEKEFEGKPFKYVSLFSGIGGFEQALNKLGGTCVLASEIDKFANQAYEVLYGHPTAGDITKIDAKDVPDHDLLVGGFPCQAFSVAGKRLGFEDTRGTLFFEVARLAREKQPKAILLENVKGLVGHDKGRTLDAIVQTLNDIGYTVDFEVLNSKYFGVPQNRERIFIVAIRDDLVEQEPWIIKGNTIVPKGKRRISEYEGEKRWNLKTFNFDWPEQETVNTRLRDILETEVDEKYYLDDEKTAKLVAQLDGSTIGGDDGIEWHGDLKTQEKVYPQNYLDVYGVMGTDGVSQCLRTMQGGNREPKIAEAQEIAHGGNLSYCINANYSKGIAPSGIGKGRRTHVEESKPLYRIRKLTPRECFRLQNFSDEALDKLKEAGTSDSQLYKMAGNAVTVSVVKAISERLLKYL